MSLSSVYCVTGLSHLWSVCVCVCGSAQHVCVLLLLPSFHGSHSSIWLCVPVLPHTQKEGTSIFLAFV